MEGVYSTSYIFDGDFTLLFCFGRFRTGLLEWLPKTGSFIAKSSLVLLRSTNERVRTWFEFSSLNFPWCSLLVFPLFANLFDFSFSIGLKLGADLSLCVRFLSSNSWFIVVSLCINGAPPYFYFVATTFSYVLFDLNVRFWLPLPQVDET